MIRPITSDDIPALMHLAQATGLFPASGLALLQQLLTDACENTDATAPFWMTDAPEKPVGVAYCEPERMTEGTWNLQLIAIHPNLQRQGRGTTLLQAVEQAIIGRGGRMLLVETSGLPDFAPTRHFYQTRGYEAEACIRDFYAAGEDKIVFRKVLYTA